MVFSIFTVTLPQLQVEQPQTLEEGPQTVKRTTVRLLQSLFILDTVSLSWTNSTKYCNLIYTKLTAGS